MAESAIRIALVGHANTGKTSLMRTLLRDTDFGTVSDHPGTTRHVEGGSLVVGDRAIITLYDTPGLEDSIGLLELLESFGQGEAMDGIERLRYFLAHSDEHPQFRQEAKVVRQLLQSDLLFYVIDCREPVLGKYRDELAILNFAARPVIPVLNFVASASAHPDLWRQQLARQSLHATVEFDTVVFSFEGEKRLYQKIQSLSGQHYDQVQSLIDERQQQLQLCWQAAARCSAELLINVAAYRVEVTAESTQLEQHTAAMQKKVRKAEADCTKSLLQLFGFHARDLDVEQLPVQQGRWQLDLFDPQNLAQFGIKAGGAAMKGAAAGAGVDLLTGGLSLGLATALGAAAGVLYSGGKRFGKDIAVRLRGHQQVCIDEATLQVLWFRQHQLLHALLDRGHAAQQPLQFKPASQALPEQWSKWLTRCRNNGQWSNLNRPRQLADPARESLLLEIARVIAASAGQARES
jgi:GTPase Era involved in 16S rRNA processing